MIVPGSASPLLTTTDGGYTIAKSLRFRSSASAYLNRTPASAGNQQKWTWSAWVKRGRIGSPSSPLFAATSGGGQNDMIAFQADNTLQLNFNGASNVVTTQVFRDPSAYYHIVVALDTTQATASNRVIFYVNGVQVTSLSATTYPSQNATSTINGNGSHRIANYAVSSSDFFDGYMTDVYLIDGQALTPSSFGETDSVTGVWKPKAYSGTYGTNGFYLKFTDVATTSGSNAGLGKDFSGNGNYWTTNNISVTSGSTYDSMIDVPTLTSATAANYAVLNPINSNATVSDGNLKSSAGASYNDALATIACDAGKGKWYFEATLLTLTANTAWIGVTKSTNNGLDHNSVDSYRTVYQANGTVYREGTPLGNTATGTTYTTNDVIGVALDTVSGSISFYKNGTLVNTTTDALYSSNSWFFYTGQNGSSWAANFGQRPFTYTPPSGFKALNTYNLPDSTIVAGNKYMDATTYTGNATARSITNAGSFKPDLVWMKARGGTDGTWAHRLIDSVRGAGYELHSSDADAESYLSTTLTAFNSNGFSLGTADRINQNGTTFVGWQWQAGQGTTSSNTSGSITSTVSVNASAGFSIVTFANTSTGSTIGHGLGVAPSMIIIKDRGSVSNWQVYHASLGNNAQLRLNTTDAQVTPSNNWNTTSPTSTVFTLGSGFAGTYSYVAYCWAEVAGFSKFGSYVGNASTDGTFVYTGFRPKYVLIKNTNNGVTDWTILDAARNTYNVANSELNADLSNAEYTANAVDFLSNGFKLRSTYGNTNGNSQTLIYAAFAENPFKYALAR